MDGIENTKSDEQLTLESLSERIAHVKEDVDDKCQALQKQIVELEDRLGADEDKYTEQIGRITMRIGSAMNHLQVLIRTISDISTLLKAHDVKLDKLGESVAINKRNLCEVNKYVKKVDQEWKAAVKEINRLSAAEEDNSKFRWKMTAVCTVGLAILFMILKGGSIWDMISHVLELL